MNRIINIFRPLFYVDSRALGLFRMLLGVLCFMDIYRRYSFIDIFYTNDSIISISTSNSFYKSFTLLTSFTKSWEVHIFFIIGLIFSIFLIIGYRTKLSQIICAIVIISIHNRAIILENAGDLMFNNILFLTLFFPLGVSLGVDSLRKSLSYKELNPPDLNNRNIGINSPQQIFSIAYLAILLQLSSIYFFTGLNKSGYDWMGGTAVYKMFQLDTFLTPVGYFLRDYITLPITKFLTYSTLSIEYAAPLLLLIPFYSHILRLIFIFCFSIFHISIRLAVKVGLFSFTMLSMFVLVIDKRIFDFLKILFKKKFYNNEYTLFYDSDCGFCHFTCRVIKRLDVFNQITFADTSFKGDKPENLEELSTKTAILYKSNTKEEWIRHEAFGKILSIIPGGFLISWIFFIPVIGNLFGWLYDQVANNRTTVSKFFGLPACDLKNHVSFGYIEHSIDSIFKVTIKRALAIVNSVIVIIIIVASINYNLVANEAVNKKMTKHGFEKFRYNKTLKKISSYPRAIQRWNMFAPTVLGTDKTVIVEATLSNGDIVNPFTGNPAVLDNVNYENLWHDHNQFWRKFFSRITKKQNSKYITTFEKWLTKNNTYFEDIIGDNKIKSVKIWSLSQKNPSINSNKEYKVYKKLLNSNNNKKNNGKSNNRKIPSKLPKK